jgi:hypothetical protein
MRCAHLFLLPRAHPHERINGAQRNVCERNEGRAPERACERRSGANSVSYLQLRNYSLPAPGQEVREPSQGSSRSRLT